MIIDWPAKRQLALWWSNGEWATSLYLWETGFCFLQMERRLDGNVKILKVWKAWGDQKDDVNFILRQHHCTDGYIDKKLSSKAPRRSKTSSGHHRYVSLLFICSTSKGSPSGICWDGIQEAKMQDDVKLCDDSWLDLMWDISWNK